MSAGAVLFVTNGHGEAAIAARIARDVRAFGRLATDHFALVGERFGADDFPDAGPQRAMPSGGLVAMGNVRAFARDLGSGWLGLFAAQLRFLQAVRRRYAAIVAVGDAYAAALARTSGLPLIFVGTAKSAYVAPYGAVERRIIGAARRVFVRDAATAAALRGAGVAAEAPGNVIVDLLAGGRHAWPAPVRIALLPGSRERAYADAERLAAVVERVAPRIAGLAAVLSIAPGLSVERFAPLLARHPLIGGWTGGSAAFSVERPWRSGRPVPPTKRRPPAAFRWWRSNWPATAAAAGTGCVRSACSATRCWCSRAIRPRPRTR